jgi:hypothetical protein
VAEFHRFLVNRVAREHTGYFVQPITLGSRCCAESTLQAIDFSFQRRNSGFDFGSGHNFSPLCSSELIGLKHISESHLRQSNTYEGQ